MEASLHLRVASFILREIRKGCGSGGGQQFRPNTLLNQRPSQGIINNNACQICNKFGHSTRLYNERGNFAYIVGSLVDATSNSPQDENIDDKWCLHSGASHHITSDIDNFYDAQSYQGISHIGIVHLNTPYVY